MTILKLLGKQADNNRSGEVGLIIFILQFSTRLYRKIRICSCYKRLMSYRKLHAIKIESLMRSNLHKSCQTCLKIFRPNRV